MVTTKAYAFICPRNKKNYVKACYNCTCNGRRTQGVGSLVGQGNSNITHE